ncbi:MAG: DNA-processing protein DprA [Actinomycetota bacterium]
MTGSDAPSAPADDPSPTLRRPADLRAEWTANRSAGRRTSGPLAWPPRFAATPADRSALLVLLGLAALTPRRLLELAVERRSATACLEAVVAGDAGSDGDRKAAAKADPTALAERVRASRARLIAVGDDEYPSALLDLFDPPAGLFVVGASLADGRERVAIVGARACSPTGRDTARGMATALSRAGVCVVSGAARGIDRAAHEGALSGSGGTIAVLGSGIDHPYPRHHRALLAEVAANGTVVSEYPPGIPAEPFRFPARNRIVAALSRAVVVVEGAAGSGSMITADHALEIGREVFAVPGSVTNPMATVPLALIRQGATLIRDAADLLLDIGLGSPQAAAVDPGRDLDPATRLVWDALAGPSLPDQLARACDVPLPDVISRLVSLEMRGLVRQIGGRFERRVLDVTDR